MWEMFVQKHLPFIEYNPWIFFFTDDSLSHNQVAAIVVGVIAFILLVVVVVYVLRSGYMQKYLYKVQDSPGLGFNNALFQKGDESHSESVKFE